MVRLQAHQQHLQSLSPLQCEKVLCVCEKKENSILQVVVNRWFSVKYSVCNNWAFTEMFSHISYLPSFLVPTYFSYGHIFYNPSFCSQYIQSTFTYVLYIESCTSVYKSIPDSKQKGMYYVVVEQVVRYLDKMAVSSSIPKHVIQQLGLHIVSASVPGPFLALL